jgi:hypothetical protein
MERGERLHRWRLWFLICLLPATIYRINLVHGLGPALQIAEGQTVELPAKTHRLLEERTNPTWSTTWFGPLYRIPPAAKTCRRRLVCVESFTTQFAKNVLVSIFDKFRDRVLYKYVYKRIQTSTLVKI